MVHNPESFRDFLRASVEESYSLNKKEFNKIYDESLHTDSSEEHDILKDIENKINYRDTQTFIIKGYKGCGKSTFCNYLKKHLSLRVVKIDFDKNIDTKLLVRAPLLEYIFKNILNDIRSGYSKITKELLSKFYWDRKSFDCFNSSFDAQNIFMDFFHFLEASMKNNDNLQRELKSEIAGKSEVNKILFLVFLWDIAYRSVSGDNRKCIFILDNLDVLVHYAPLGELFDEYYTFLSNCREMISKIYRDYKLLLDYFFVFVVRETTRATVIEHLHDKNPRTQNCIEYDFSAVIPKECVLEKRLNYLENSQESDNVKKIALELNRLRNDRFIKEHFFYLFNEDYRTSIETLCKFIEDKKTRDTFKDKFIQDYFDIKSSHPHNTTVGSHGLFIRLLCNLFLEEKYLAKVLSTEVRESEFSNRRTNHNVPSINISRLLLTYLKNQDKAISIQEILKAFNGICKQDMVFDAIGFLFEFKDMQYWNHLVTFDKLIELDNSQDQLNSENFINKLDKDSTIQITFAGRFFLDAILIHFEYFSCRANSSFQNQNSLFDKKNAERIDNNPDLDFIFVEIIQNTLNLVKDCCARITKYYKAVFQDKCHFNDDIFLESDLAYHIKENNIDNSMFHTERVVHSHIDYLDVYRRYVINILKNNEQKKEANEKIIHYIKEYMNMFGYYNKSPVTHFSDQTRMLCRLYNKCINRIIESGYTDFELPIDRNTGHELDQLGD